MAEKSLEEYSAEEVAQMAATYNALVNNPETREVTLRATKKLNPHLSIPEVDLKDQARAAFADQRKEMDELKGELRQRDARERITNERNALKADGFDVDDIAAIEKIMTDEQIPNYSTAAKYYRNGQQLAEPTPNTGSQPGTTYDLPKEAMDANKGGKQGLTKFARSQAEAAMAEIARGQIKLH